MKKKTSVNKRTLWILTLIAILSGAIIISMFCFVEKYQIRNRATETLEDFAVNPGGAYGEISPEIYFISTEDLGDDSLTEMDQKLLAYYLERKKTIPLEKVCHFSSGRLEAYFFARAAAPDGGGADDVLLLYTDVSFISDLLRTAVYSMAAVFILLSVVLYAVARYMVRVLDEKDKTMKDFFANASHELKTPIMAIRGYAEGLKEGIVDQEKACFVIVNEIERMSRLISMILQLSKLDSGIVKPHMELNDVREILYDAVQVIEPAAEQKKIAVTLELPKPLLYRCDEEMLFSVFSNILTNAVRYGERDIRVSADCREPAGLRIWISNDGNPIPQEDLKHMFDRFYRGVGGQTGIGMALSQEYMKLHGGSISVFVREGKTVFEVTISLPL